MGIVWFVLEGIAAVVRGVFSLLGLTLKNQKKLEQYHSVDAKDSDEW